MEKIAFFGGSFNPPSKVHYQIAKNILDNLQIDKICFVPVGNYYKKQDLIDVKYRYEMLNIMSKDELKMFVSDITLEERNNLKAIDIFKKIKQKYQDKDIYFVMGSDNFFKILNWKEPEQLVKNYKIIVIVRDNLNINNLICSNKILKDNKNNIFILNCEDTKNTIDSTQIRNMIINKENVNNFLHKDVINYIDNNKLY